VLETIPFEPPKKYRKIKLYKFLTGPQGALGEMGVRGFTGPRGLCIRLIVLFE
jgi:hypothetical protein